MTSGLTPVVADETILAITGTLSFLASSSSMRSTPEAASFIPDELPAVTLPSSLNDGLSLASFSIVTSLLGYSSVS